MLSCLGDLRSQMPAMPTRSSPVPAQRSNGSSNGRASSSCPSVDTPLPTKSLRALRSRTPPPKPHRSPHSASQTMASQKPSGTLTPPTIGSASSPRVPSPNFSKLAPNKVSPVAGKPAPSASKADVMSMAPTEARRLVYKLRGTCTHATVPACGHQRMPAQRLLVFRRLRGARQFGGRAS